jgi:ABC-type bacteriocin/lantibiotic exporter with double-glycine peptidase domain
MNRSAWRYYVSFYDDPARVLVWSVLSSLGPALTFLPIALLVRQVFDTAIPQRDFLRLGIIGAALFFLYVANAAITFWTSYLTSKAIKEAIWRLRTHLLEKIYQLPRAYYSRTDLSKLHTSIVQDTDRLDVTSQALLVQLLPVLVITAVLVFINWTLFLVMAVIAPILYVVNRRMGRVLRTRVQAYHRSFEEFSKGTLLVLQRMDLTRAQSAEQFEIGRQGKHLEELRTTSWAMSWLYTAYSLTLKGIVAIANVGVLIVGGVLVAANYMTLGEMLSFYVVLSLLKDYGNTMVSAVPQVIAGTESLTTLHNISTLQDALPYSGTKRITFDGRLALDSVDFRYIDQPVLCGVSLDIEPGSTTAVVGPNGAGKSTIINLVLGFYRPQQGQLYADGQPYEELDLAHLRGQIGVVLQDAVLLPGTVYENVTYGSPGATGEQVARAVELAMAGGFIAELPYGYDTQVGDEGATLSGGQRQRIAIARALLRRQPLLILDEPTNHLESAAVRQFMRNLKSLDYAPAILLISHDPAVVREADNVYVLREGRLVESGPDASLVQEEGAALSLMGSGNSI